MMWKQLTNKNGEWVDGESISDGVCDECGKDLYATLGLCEVCEMKATIAEQAEQIKEQQAEIQYLRNQIADRWADIKRQADERQTIQAENQRLKQAILKYGNGNDFDWDVLEEIDRLETAITETLEENRHLADGDDCTLIKLKRAMERK